MVHLMSKTEKGEEKKKERKVKSAALKSTRRPKLPNMEARVPTPGGVSLKGRTVFITVPFIIIFLLPSFLIVPLQGASRGIGRSIALRCARDGANVVIAAKTAQPHSKLPGTIHSVAAEVEAAGGKALAVECDIRLEEQVKKAVDDAVARFGGIDVLVNNASAIWPRPILETPMKRYDLMHSINGRGTFLCSQVCLPHLQKSAQAGRNPHILMISPPLSYLAKWFEGQVAYSIAKYNMSMVALGLSAELRSDGIAVNALWPRTAIATAAIEFITGSDMLNSCRKPEIMADAAHRILTSPAQRTTGGFFIDDDVLRAAGATEADIRAYSVKPGAKLALDYFVEDDGSLGNDAPTLRPRL